MAEKEISLKKGSWNEETLWQPVELDTFDSVNLQGIDYKMTISLKSPDYPMLIFSDMIALRFEVLQSKSSSREIVNRDSWRDFMKLTYILLALALLVPLAYSMPAPIHIGHGLIGDHNPYKTGAIVLGSYFNPDQAFYSYGRCEARQFDSLRLESTDFYWSPPTVQYL